MKKNWLFAIALASSMATSQSSLAGLATWTQYGTINHLAAGYAEDTVTVKLSAPLANPANCTGTSSWGYYASWGAPSKKVVMAALLAAHIAKKRVKLYIEGNSCLSDKAQIAAVDIEP